MIFTARGCAGAHLYRISDNANGAEQMGGSIGRRRHQTLLLGLVTPAFGVH